MHGVGGTQQLANLAPANDSNVQTDKGFFGQLKVTVVKGVRNILSANYSSIPDNAKLASRNITVLASALHPLFNERDNDGAKGISPDFEQALKEASNNPKSLKFFSRINQELEKIQQLQEKLSELYITNHALLKKPGGMNTARFKEVNKKITECQDFMTGAKQKGTRAQENFNKTVDPQLKLDIDALQVPEEKRSPESAKDLAKFEKMKTDLLKR
ncbi:hypothetical protein J7438_11735 [Thalassotalea sp. G20_0]|uniref:hypothetical protein n=1 Tax=Thalassotalea sp. G20_0 TaxID=2821093 RepID=UPI001ADD355A|nr:hypothetical protein [Thalassotalea sp. G20_0]MBO9494759.1 hypothetical protein [Thalassotalea sp. G20_0]